MFLEALFADTAEDVRNGAVDEELAREAAMEAVETYIPAALAVFGYGSAFTGGYLPYSDVDVVALVEHGESISNYCFIARGIPVDIHIIGADSIDRIVGHAAKSGVNSILSSIAGGKVLHDPQGLAAGLRERCALALLEGPRPALPREITALRWMLTTQLIDIAQDRPMAEVHAAALSAYPMLLQLCTIGAGTWRNRGKWAIRQPEQNPESRLLSALIDSYSTLFAAGDKAPMIDAALAILDRVGGPLCFGQGNAINLTASVDREHHAPVGSPVSG